MSQRLYAAVVAGVLFVALVVAAFALPVPYVVYSPGVTVDVLGFRNKPLLAPQALSAGE